MNLKELTQRAMEIRQKYSEQNQQKGLKEWTNLSYMEGFVGDVGDLMKLVMAKEGLREKDNIDEKLAHELADCLWCVLILSERYEIDLEKEFLKTMDKLEQKLKLS